MRERHQKQIVAFRAELADAPHRYGQAVDIASYSKRLAQLDAAIPWVVEDGGE
jgi:hypothetical protein